MPGPERGLTKASPPKRLTPAPTPFLLIRMRLPLWLSGLLATSCIQMAGSFMSQSLPVVAPLLTVGIGVGREQIGVITALNSLGSILFMAFGTPLIAAMGPLTALRAAVCCGAAALALLSVGLWPIVMLSALLMGLAYGPAPPASTRILAATAVPRHRGLTFSIKQAAAQAGGVLAGLTIAPMAAHFGWAAGLALPVTVGVLAAVAVAPLSGALEIARDPPRRVSLASLFQWRTIKRPFAAVGSSTRLMALTVLTTCLAVVQGCLFSFCVTYLVTSRGMTLQEAGIGYACMQGGGMAGRIFVGWAADRSQNAWRNIVVQAWASAGLVVVWALMPGDLGLSVLGPMALVMGLVCASWPGLILAEVSRLAPPGGIAEAASGSTMITFAGYVVGPVLFAAGVRLTGDWLVPYLLVAAQMALMAAAQTVLLLRHGRAGAPREGIAGAPREARVAGAVIPPPAPEAGSSRR